MTPLKLADLVSIPVLNELIEAGYVRRREHPGLPLSILNYSEKAQYERAWTNETRRCRGLIVDADNVVVAQPWAKFFNYGEYQQGKFDTVLDLSAPVQVTDKMDGSLGILYPTPEGAAIATRGSFISEQALHATTLYRQLYEDTWTPQSGVTYLFEIIYPENRIVLDYAGLDDLVLLGGVTNEGEPVGPDALMEWPGRSTQVYDYPTLAAALAAEPRANAEGMVVRFLDSGLMVKIKQDDYVALHRLVTGLNERVVWEHLSAGGGVGSLIEAIPDEFHGWVHDKAAALTRAHDDIAEQAVAAHARLLAIVGSDASRRAYAEATAEYPQLRPLLFNLLDGRDPSANIWKTLRPRGDTYMLGITEDVA